MTVNAVLFSEMTPDETWESDFHVWYDQEHIPLRMAAPGFLGARRYKASEGDRNYLAVYDLEATSALHTDAYREIKERPSQTTRWMLNSVTGFTRYIGELSSWQVQSGLTDDELLASSFLYAVFFTVPQECRRDFDDWYVEDHVPHLLGSSDWLGCRRYNIVNGAPEGFTHMALHHLRSLDALTSPARAAARSTPWRNQLAAEPWFKGHYMTFDAHGNRFRGNRAL